MSRLMISATSAAPLVFTKHPLTLRSSRRPSCEPLIPRHLVERLTPTRRSILRSSLIKQNLVLQLAKVNPCVVFKDDLSSLRVLVKNISHLCNHGSEILGVRRGRIRRR